MGGLVEEAEAVAKHDLDLAERYVSDHSVMFSVLLLQYTKKQWTNMKQFLRIGHAARNT